MSAVAMGCSPHSVSVALTDDKPEGHFHLSTLVGCGGGGEKQCGDAALLQVTRFRINRMRG
jgi:hypothetical protein